jgi:hypothetical protein
MMNEQQAMPPVLTQYDSEKDSSNKVPRVIAQGNNNMAYVNISSEGNKPVGPIGLKKAEKDLIMRRYKYNHQNTNDNMSRVAVIYGQQPSQQYNSHDRGYMNDPTQASSANYSRGPGAYYN